MYIQIHIYFNLFVRNTLKFVVQTFGQSCFPPQSPIRDVVFIDWRKKICRRLFSRNKMLFRTAVLPTFVSEILETQPVCSHKRQ